MTQEEYLENLQKKFEKHFELEKDVSLLGERIDLHARFSNIIGRTFITKHDVIDKCENYEYCYIRKLNLVSGDAVLNYGSFLKQIVDEFISPGADHMSTYVTGIIVGNSVDDDAKKAVESYSCSRAYSFYLKGWCDVRLICIDLSGNEVVTNKAGKRVKKVYQPTP